MSDAQSVSSMRYYVGAAMLVILGAAVLSAAIGVLTAIPSDKDLSPAEGIAVAWAIIGCLLGPALWLGASFLVMLGMGK